MDAIYNLKKLGLKENRKYLILVIWLLVNITIIQFPFDYIIQFFNISINLFDLLGIVLYIPFLTFLTFLFILSLISKKDVKEIAAWKVILIFFGTLPLMILLAFILFGMFMVSVISYVLLSSWFILYGAHLSSKRLDNALKRKIHSKIYRTLEFFVFSILALLLLGAYLIGSQYIIELLGLTIKQIYIDILNFVVIFVGFIIIGYIIVGVIFLFKKFFNAWLGMFSLFIAIYTFYLLAKIFLAIRSTGGSETSLFTQLFTLIADLGILLYSISTLMGSQAQMLSKRINSKRLGLDTFLIFIIYSKVSYEFVHNFPFDLLRGFFYNQILDILSDSLINLWKNIGVFAFFVLILVVMGFYQMKKYNLQEKKFKHQVEKDVKELLSYDGELMLDQVLPETSITETTTTHEKFIDLRNDVDKSEDINHL
ncbi:MAG: hypothetical protein ACFFKA_07690 [Candidatus Thorarchaeota archaeon]